MLVDSFFMKTPRRLIAAAAFLPSTLVAACSAASSGRSNAPEDAWKPDSPYGMEAGQDAAAYDAVPVDAVAADDVSLVCEDAMFGRTDTDACAPASTSTEAYPCKSACDCCFYQPGGAACLNGYCSIRHGQ